MPQNKSRLPNSLNGQGWSGLDPLDASRTAANVEGVFLKRLFTLKLRTRNIFSLITMLVFGVSATGLMSIAIYAVSSMVSSARPIGKPDPLAYLALAIFYFLVGLVLLIGIALLVNFSINLGIILGFIRSKSGSKNREEQNRKEPKKKLPKRRKDFR
jgi:hypothetical protein